MGHFLELDKSFQGPFLFLKLGLLVRSCLDLYVVNNQGYGVSGKFYLWGALSTYLVESKSTFGVY